MLDQLIHFDQQLLLLLNGHGVPFWDAFFSMVTRTQTWIPLAAAFLVVLFTDKPWKEALLVVVMFALVITCADQFASTFCKPFFHRFRPSHEPALEGLVHLVDGRAGGLYGFISSHAANTFGVMAFVAVVVRKKVLSLTLVCWACLSSYSRIYLGLHYPGDILAGACCGMIIGFGLGLLTKKVSSTASVESLRNHTKYVAFVFWLTLPVLILISLYHM